MTTKCVKLCRNGDNFFPPVNVVVNPRDIRSMDAFLDRVTQATRMRNAARKVCTPKKGHRIEDLTKLISGETYVAVGQEAFKNLEYGSIRLRRPVIQHREIKIEPVKHSRILMSARCRKVALWESSGLKTIYVYRNGDDKYPSHKILLDRRTLLNMDKVLELVTERVKLESGAVFALCTMFGKEVNNTSELINGEKYVAVGHGKRFKRTAYNDNQNVSPNNSPRRAKVKYKVFVTKKSFVLPSAGGEKQKDRPLDEGSSRNEVKGKALNTHESFNNMETSRNVENESNAEGEEAKAGSQKPSFSRTEAKGGKALNTQKSSGTIQTSQHVDNTQTNNGAATTDNRSRGVVEKPLQKTESKNHVKKLTENEGAEDRPHESVFKASGAKSEKAKPVEDDKEIKVEKPIDQVPAEEVVEEIIDQNPSQNEQEKDKPQEQVRPSSKENIVNNENTASEDKE